MRHGRFRRFGGRRASSAGRLIDPGRSSTWLGRLAVLAAVASLGGLYAVACGSSATDAEAPVAALGGTPDAGIEFSSLQREWVLGSPERRLELEDALQAFVKRHPDDDLVRLARVLLAFNALERGEDRRARKSAQQALLGPPGTARDLGALIVGVADRRMGRHEQALERLRPLLHKLIDPFATAMLDEELVEAALGARRWREAMGYMAIWLRETEPASRKAVAARIERMLNQVATEQLLASLSQITQGDEVDADADMARLIAARLGAVAREAKDGDLARVLLDRFGALLGSQGEAVARLAAESSRARVAAHTLGLVLSLRSPELSQRSADVTAGMAFGLGLPGSGARLVTRDAGSSVAEHQLAMQELAAAGAAVIVAGVDPGAVSAAVEFSESHGLPIVLLSDPGPLGASRGTGSFVFVLGESAARSMGLLVQRLREDGAKRFVGFGSARAADLGEAGGAGKPKRDQEAGGPGRPVGGDETVGTLREYGCPGRVDAAELRALAVDALLVRDGAACGAELLPLVKGLRARLGIGLGVPRYTDRLPESSWVLVAGVFPAHPDRPDPALDGWFKTGRGVPSWWTALGRDAAVLGWKAIRGLSDVATDDPKQVRARRAQAAAGLVAASSPLWTSDARGFGPDRRVARTITVRRAQAGGGSGRR